MVRGFQPNLRFFPNHGKDAKLWLVVPSFESLRAEIMVAVVPCLGDFPDRFQRGSETALKLGLSDG